MSSEFSAVSPSPEVLAEAARHIAEAYPGLYNHQQTGIAFLLSRRRAILADDMGLGKTRQAIIALREAAPAGPYLVICPASVKLTWKREIELLEPDATIAIVSGAGLLQSARWTVINYDLLSKFEMQLIGLPWAGIVVDEAHYIKNQSERSRVVLNLLGITNDIGVEPEAVYLLTGTPMANRPRDLFNLLKAVRHPLGLNFAQYAVRYCNAFNNGFGLDTRGASNLDELAVAISDVMLRRTKDEALDLPRKNRSWPWIEVNSEHVQELEGQALDYFRANPETSGPTWLAFLGLLNSARHALALQKIPFTIDAVNERLEADEKVIVYSNYTKVVESVMEAFSGKAVAITGDMSAEARQAAADALQSDPSVRVLVGNIKAAGVGLTLTAATHVVFNDFGWVPAEHWQAEDRIYRIGQTRPVFITYLVALGTLDEYVSALLERKAQLISVLEDHAAANASLVEQVVQAAINKEGSAKQYQPPSDRRTVGLAPEYQQRFLQMRHTLNQIVSEEKVFQVASASRPGKYHIVRLTSRGAYCTCEGFTRRGDCRHVSQILAKETGAALPTIPTRMTISYSYGRTGRSRRAPTNRWGGFLRAR